MNGYESGHILLGLLCPIELARRRCHQLELVEHSSRIRWVHMPWTKLVHQGIGKSRHSFQSVNVM